MKEVETDEDFVDRQCVPSGSSRACSRGNDEGRGDQFCLTGGTEMETSNRWSRHESPQLEQKCLRIKNPLKGVVYCSDEDVICVSCHRLVNTPAAWERALQFVNMAQLTALRMASIGSTAAGSTRIAAWQHELAETDDGCSICVIQFFNHTECVQLKDVIKETRCVRPCADKMR